MPACLSGTRAPAALVGPAARSAVCGVCAQDKRDRFQLIDLVGSTRRLPALSSDSRRMVCVAQRCAVPAHAECDLGCSYTHLLCRSSRSSKRCSCQMVSAAVHLSQSSTPHAQTRSLPHAHARSRTRTRTHTLARTNTQPPTNLPTLTRTQATTQTHARIHAQVCSAQ
jgi:hypothetical protein